MGNKETWPKVCHDCPNSVVLSKESARSVNYNREKIFICAACEPYFLNKTNRELMNSTTKIRRQMTHRNQKVVIDWSVAWEEREYDDVDKIPKMLGLQQDLYEEIEKV